MAKFNASFGRARYVFTTSEPPAWLIDAIPGARDLHDAWQAENARGEELAREWQRSGRELAEFRTTNPLAADLERAERAHAEKQRALDAQAKRALAALRRFDEHVSANLAEVDGKALAAREALAAHAEAVEAYEVLLSALDRREQAFAAAGRPGIRDWTRTLRNPLGSKKQAEETYRRILEGFDPVAVERVAEGEEVASRAALLAQAADETEAQNRRVAAATRKREREGR
ncbi:hypothetical protein [Agromyces indicus]|uniref:Uncharacterized protein n=1 Tax=Agromyces indicus TaxID=758919 RepID=A0ABU1FJD4_9MICO|nr:hypothetical protein [Agromyces indicus]MDR5691868.1 hypothetical protein [Agromyces indicus]